MKRLRAWLLRTGGLFHKEQRSRAISDEIESHLELHIDDNLRLGMTPDLARRNAILKLGGVESAKQAYRERNTIPFLENLLQDIGFSARQLRKNPGFTGTVVFTLALGLCASVAIFAFVDAALIKPLPYKDPTRLVGVFESAPLCPKCYFSYPDYLDWKKTNQVFSSLDIYQRLGFMLSTPDGTEPAHGVRVSDGFFRTLAVKPVFGRDFVPGEDLLSAPRTVLLSYPAWQKRYGGSRDVLGKTVTLDGAINTIIGVLPPDFHFAPAGAAEFWTTMHAASECDLRRSCHGLWGIARLKDGVSVAAALANTKGIAQRLETLYPDSNRGQGASVLPLSDVIVGDVRPILLVLLGGAGLLLLIAFVNIVSLLLVRSESRRREMAVRDALGASRMRLARHFVTEGLMLVALASVVGLAVAYWAMQLLAGLIPMELLGHTPYFQGLGLNVRVVAFAGVIAVLAAVMFSITPTLNLSLSGLRAGLSEGSRGSSGMTWRRLGSTLVVVELATAMVLLAGAGLLGKSFYRLLHVDLAFHADRLATVEIGLPKSSAANDGQTVALARRLVSGAASLPGVQSAAIATLLPISGNGNTDWIRFVGRPFHGEHNEVNERDVSSEYLKTLQARLLRGRYFSDAEDSSKHRVVIINQALAQRYFPGEDPIGKQFGDGGLSPKSLKEIVGIVENVREGALDSDIWPAYYAPFNQSPDTSFSIVVRTSQSEESILPELVAAVHRIDPGIAAFDVSTMNTRINGSPAAYMHRSSAWLVGGFAAVALLLAVVGLYGVVAYSVSQRTREIGVRMALGAERNTVYRLILKEAGRLAAGGIVIGLACSVGSAVLMRKVLFGTAAWDVPTLLAVAGMLAVSAVLASYIPAHRAASINPIDALRAE